MKLDAVHWGGKWGPSPVICATSAWNGLAFNPYQIWACRRAELTAFAETPFRCGNGQRATMAQIRTLPVRSQGLERMSTIAGRLIEELLPKLKGLPGSSRIALALCLSERFDKGLGIKHFSIQR